MAVVAPDLRKLQAEIDQMKERLDFIAPMLPLLNVAREFFQRMECEATVQLARLRGSRVLESSASPSSDISTAANDTARWLHLVTQAVIDLHVRQTSDAHVSAPGAAATGSVSVVTGANDFARPGRKTSNDLAGAGTVSSSLPGFGLPPNTNSRHLGAHDAALDGPDRCGVEGMPWVPSVSSQRRSPTPPRTSPRGMPPSTQGGAAGSGSSFSGAASQTHNSIRLGQGSWATAYRSAHGQRLEALQLLCRCGIVTARELSDDLTVITQDHIDDCCMIAVEMLQARPLDYWIQVPDDARKHFEESFTQLYQRKHHGL